jgi:putative hydrolase of the HAD superfamily
VKADARIEAVLFDAAGTLIELREPVGDTYARFARDHGVDLPAWRIDDAFRRIFAQAPPLVFPEAAADEVAARERGWWRAVVRSTFLATDSTARFDDFDAFFDALFVEFSRPACWRVRSGCEAMLETLQRRGLALGVVSNFDRRLHGLLAAVGIAERLDVVVLPSDALAQKPAPAIFELALTRLGVPASSAVFVGDSHAEDIRGARSVGMHAVDVGSLANWAEFPDRLERLAARSPEPIDD